MLFIFLFSPQPSEIFFYLFLPPLLLDSAVRVDWYIFKKVAVAVCGCVCDCVVVAVTACVCVCVCVTVCVTVCVAVTACVCVGCWLLHGP